MFIPQVSEYEAINGLYSMPQALTDLQEKEKEKNTIPPTKKNEEVTEERIEIEKGKEKEGEEKIEVETNTDVMETDDVTITEERENEKEGVLEKMEIEEG